MKAEQLMTRNPRVCSRTDTLDDAARIMWESDCGLVPVVEPGDGAGRLAGVVTDRDICMAAYTTGQSLKQLPVEHAMSRELRTCSPETPIREAERIMREARIRRLPVVDDEGRIVGILSLADLACEASREHERPSPEISEAEVGSTLGAITQPHAFAIA